MSVLTSTLVKYVSHTVLTDLRGGVSLKEVSRFRHYNVEQNDLSSNFTENHFI